MNCLHVICVINIMFHYLTSTRVISTITIILNPLVISYKKNIYTGSYLCVFIRVRLTSSISYSLYNIAEYALFTYVIHIYHIPLYNITEYALFTYVIHIYHIPLNNITDFAHKLNVMFHYIKS